MSSPVPLKDPFPHLVIYDFYNSEELNLIWEELNFYTKPGKLLEAKDYGAADNKTNAKALFLDRIYSNHRSLSNILTVNRKIFSSGILHHFASINDECAEVLKTNADATKVRYYHDGDYYEPHTDPGCGFLTFSYFYKEPKKFSGGELFFPDHDSQLTCENNSLIIFPEWVKHGVNEVKIKDSDYYDGWGRYCISNFIFSA